MERKDLLEKNCGIFKEQVNLFLKSLVWTLIFDLELIVIYKQGGLLNTVASKTVKVILSNLSLSYSLCVLT